MSKENKIIKKIKDKKKKIGGRILAPIFLGCAIFLIALSIAIAGVFYYDYKYQGKIFPGVKISGIDVGKNTQDRAFKIIEEKKEDIRKTGLIFIYNENKVAVPAVLSATDPDLARTVFSFDISKSIAEAYGIGRQQDWINNAIDRILLMFNQKNILVHYDLNIKEFEDILKTEFAELESPAQDAALKIFSKQEIEVLPEQLGIVFDYSLAIEKAKENLSALNNREIEMSFEIQEPKIIKDKTREAINKVVEYFIATTSPTLFYENNKWKISENEMLGWLEFYIPPENSEVDLRFKEASTTEYLKEIAKKIDIEAQDAKFRMENGRVVEFKPNKNGKKLDIKQTYEKINNDFFNIGSNNIEIIIDVAVFKVAIGDLNDLGIKELIGTGISNFAGSPKNRRHNIAVGAETLNGILIAPGEEFSLLKALGEINKHTGYLPELVIKGNRTVPEYGGGLCQIGTTTFRAALRSGLPIIERRNHSYRVIYYEPAGMDATIYNPKPDMRFLNDTNNYILFTARIAGDDLIFEFYGTKDGRTVEIFPEPPKIYNITAPGEPRYIETDELEPGEKKKVESSHHGANTEFTYKVVYPDGTIKQEDFFSRYVAWPEVWLIGKDLSATSSDEIIGESAEQ